MEREIDFLNHHKTFILQGLIHLSVTVEFIKCYICKPNTFFLSGSQYCMLGFRKFIKLQ